MKTFKVPSWCGLPPWHRKRPRRLEVISNGKVTGFFSLLDKAYFTVGHARVSENDILLSHTSISRQHAVLLHKKDGTVFVMDLGSTHGTFVDGRRIEANKPHPIVETSELMFGASSRIYRLCTANLPGSATPPALSPKKQDSVENVPEQEDLSSIATVLDSGPQRSAEAPVVVTFTEKKKRKFGEEATEGATEKPAKKKGVSFDLEKTEVVQVYADGSSHREGQGRFENMADETLELAVSKEEAETLRKKARLAQLQAQRNLHTSSRIVQMRQRPLVAPIALMLPAAKNSQAVEATASTRDNDNNNNNNNNNTADLPSLPVNASAPPTASTASPLPSSRPTNTPNTPTSASAAFSPRAVTPPATAGLKTRIAFSPRPSPKLQAVSPSLRTSLPSPSSPAAFPAISLYDDAALGSPAKVSPLPSGPRRENNGSKLDQDKTQKNTQKEDSMGKRTESVQKSIEQDEAEDMFA